MVLSETRSPEQANARYPSDQQVLYDIQKSGFANV
jgi:hypothetical protein